jgi:NosL protein
VNSVAKKDFQVKKWPLIVIFLFLLVALAASLMKKSEGESCALDATKIEPIYQVDITPREGKILKFCCIECARKWLAANKGRVSAVTVTDEVTGKRIDASIAFFVESSVVTNQSTGNKIHVFEEKADAEKHARDFNGTVIENPFK